LLLGRILSDSGKPKDGEPHLRRALELFKTKYPAEDWRIPQAASALGGCLMAQGRIDEAGPLVTENWPKIRDVLGKQHKRTKQAADRAIAWYESTGDKTKADEVRSALR